MAADDDDAGKYAATVDLRVAATIDGTDPGLQFHSIEISQRLFEPTRVRLELGYGDDRERGRHADALGKKLALTIQDELASKISQKYAGIITGFTQTSDSITLEAQSLDFRLTAPRRHRTFKNMTAADIVKQVVSDCGLTEAVDSTSETFAFMQQYAESDAEFIARLAAYSGYWFHFEDEKFLFKKGFDTGNAVEVDDADLADIVMRCRVEDVQKKRGSFYNHELHDDPGNGVANSKPTDLPVKGWKKVFSDSGNGDEEYNLPFKSAGSLKDYLAGQDGNTASDFVRVEGETHNPMVVVGKTLTTADPILGKEMVVVGLQATFSGNVYTGRFEAIPNSIVMAPEPVKSDYAVMLQPGVVTDNKDETKMGRVKVKFFWNSDEETYWARVVQPGAGGDGHGTYFTPRVGDSVLVGFENGDVSQPVILGALYQSEKLPSFKTENGTEEVLVAKTPVSTIRIVDTQNSEHLLITMNDTKNVIKMELQGPKITIESQSGTIAVHSKTIQITADDKLELTANDIEMKAQQNLKVTTGQDLSMTVGGKSTESVSMDKSVTAGQKASISAGTEASISGTTKASVSAIQVESTAAATNTIKGATVMIN